MISSEQTPSGYLRDDNEAKAAQTAEFLLVEELVVSADLQQVVVHVQVIQVVLRVAQRLIDQQVHGGRT